MVSSPLASIGGIASGLDTGTIVQQLMQLEALPMRAIEQRQAQYRRQDDAWGQIVTRLSNLRSVTDQLSDGSWVKEAVTARSSSESIATVSATGAALPGSVTFEVEQLAARHQVAFGQRFGDPAALVGEGSIVVTQGEETVEVELGEGATIADAARALNGVDGISAQLLRTGDDGYQLIVTANASGATGSFDLTADGLTGFDEPVQVLREGQDARINLGGAGNDALIVTRATNTFDDLLEGVTVRLYDTGSVAVEVEADHDAAVNRVQDFVTAANAFLDELARQSRTSTEANQRGPLSADSLARSLAANLRSTITGVRGEGDFATLTSIGIELTRDGKLELNQTRLREALESDPEAVASLLGRTSNASDPRVQVLRPGTAPAGEYQLYVDTAATIASRTGASYSPPTGEPKTFTISVPGGDPVEVTLTTEDLSAGAAVAKINNALMQANIERVRATADGDRIVLMADQPGASRTFTVEGSGDLDLDGTFTGTNAQGTITIDDETFPISGTGQSLTVQDGPAQGMVIRVPTDVTGELGSIVIADGLGGVMNRFLSGVEGPDGSIARARSSLEARVEAGKTSLERFEIRLAMRETTLRRQFTMLETAMAQAQQQAQYLAGALGGLMS